MVPETSYGVITEQGDLGLGFDPLNEADNKILNGKEKEESENK